MPSDTTHIIFNFAVLSGLFVLHTQYPILTTVQAAVFTIMFFIGSTVLTPDLDTNSKSSNRCGAACYPYKKLSKHRGISHHIIWGVALRIVYASAIIIILTFIVGLLLKIWVYQNYAFVPSLLIQYKIEVLSGIAGMFVSNALHIFLDKLS